MPAYCVDCQTEIESGLLCEHCAPLVAETLKKLKPTGKKPSYHEYARRVPLRPVTLPPVRFGQEDEG